MNAQPVAIENRSYEKPLLEATLNEWQWKTPAMKAMTLAVCKLALARGVAGEFSARDLPTHGAEAHGGSGIAGSVFRQLIKAGIIAVVGKFVDGTFYPQVKLNAAGNKIGVYRLAHPGLCRALLNRHAPESVTEPHQEEMAL